MIQSVLSNLGILLLMHLMINTGYYLNQTKKLSNTFMPIFHILIVTLAIISMFHFPIRFSDHLFDLRIAPLIFVSFYHGWRYTVPVLIMASLYRFFLGGETVAHEILFGMILSSILPIILYPQDQNRFHFLKPFLVVTAAWLISDLPIIWLMPEGLEIFTEIALVRYLSLLLGSFILYFFIVTGQKHLTLTKQMRYFAERDPLTGLYNMRKFEDAIHKYIPQNKLMYIAMVDIDCFKKINDTFGHQAGDTAIKTVGEIILNNRSKDMFAARYGGDEYILFIAVDHPDQAMATLNEIRKRVASAPLFPNSFYPDFKISLSIGVAPLNTFKNLKEAIDLADRQLYFAKHSGKNQVCS